MFDNQGRALELGRRIRALRKAAGLTVVVLAERCEISQPFLSQIERGLATPSLTTLYALAHQLDVPLGSLLDPPSDPVDGRGAQVIQASEGSGQLARVLIPGGASARLEAFEHSFVPGLPDRDWFGHPGEDFIYVLEGAVQLQREGFDPVTLVAGDAIVYEGTAPHRCVLHGDAPARTILVSLPIDPVPQNQAPELIDGLTTSTAAAPPPTA